MAMYDTYSRGTLIITHRIVFMQILIASFNNMRTLKLKGQPTNAFFATVNQMFGGSSQLPTVLIELGSTMWFDYCALDSSRMFWGAAEH